ncbi:MAG: hypothetical protein Q9184_005567 [Pyrenodesmia sp. 2 TL-2023]
MKLHQVFTTLLLLALPVFSLDILLPLYLYPGPDASAWSDILSTISSHPNVNFQVVVNPNSGPGTSSFPTDANIIAGIVKLNSHPNVRTVGYVLTQHGTRDTALVKADVDVYASWASYTDAGADIAIGGIYFDEVSSETTSKNYDHYAALAAHAREKIPGGKVVFNPGYRAPVQLFEYCDTMVEFEDSLANYVSQGILGQIPAGFEGKSAVQVYDTPEGTDVGALMGEMAGKGLGAVYFGEDCCYKVWNRGLLQRMADSV